MIKAQIIEMIKNMTVLELADLVKAMEEEFGVTAAAPAASGGSAVAVVEVVEEQTEFDVILLGPGEKKINVIKVVRELTGLGLVEAKALVDNPPKAVKEKITKEEANIVKTKLTDAGASVEIK
ncbi:MAG: 50S ribosomal protein L7/L12 [bacterium]|nr:50S ribosomal protein L7/L12 [bacterium]